MSQTEEEKNMPSAGSRNKNDRSCLNELITNYRGRRLPGKEVSGKQSSLFI